MHYREDAYRMAYELRAPNHRLTSELLQHLETAADHVTRYPPICLSVYHMATQELHAIPDHDVYVNTREMTYCVELHETPFCLVRERDKDDLDQYHPCECHEVRCGLSRAAAKHTTVAERKCTTGVMPEGADLGVGVATGTVVGGRWED